MKRSILQMIDKKIVHVSAAVIRNVDDELLLSSRKLADGRVFWEFPGGKIEPGESPSAAAGRELKEELDLKVYPADTVYITLYDYGDKIVELNFVRCFCFDFSTMKMLDEQSVKWCKVSDIDIDEMLAADREFIKFLQSAAINP